MSNPFEVNDGFEAWSFADACACSLDGNEWTANFESNANTENNFHVVDRVVLLGNSNL
jgi:hypothetical protein